MGLGSQGRPGTHRVAISLAWLAVWEEFIREFTQMVTCIRDPAMGQVWSRVPGERRRRSQPKMSCFRPAPGSVISRVWGKDRSLSALSY